MIVSKKKYQFVKKIIAAWEKEGVITGEMSEKLSGSIEPAAFDWKKLAKYSFLISGISLAIAVGALLLDDAIMTLIRELFSLQDGIKSLLLALVSAAIYGGGFVLKKVRPRNFFSNEFLLFIGAIVTGGALFFLGHTLDTGSGHYSVLIFIAMVVYCFVGVFFPSVPMWVLGLLSMSTWFGTETGYVSGWGAYFLGMNYPLRFVILGCAMVAVSFALKKSMFSRVARSTYVMGMLNLFIALWMMSLWGNYGDLTEWHMASLAERMEWSFLFGFAAVGVLLWGIKNDDKVARGFGITFLLINLYTKYFEFFWNVMHKAVFFVILAVSFWVVGRYAEKVFTMIKEKILDNAEDEE